MFGGGEICGGVLCDFEPCSFLRPILGESLTRGKMLTGPGVSESHREKPEDTTKATLMGVQGGGGGGGGLLRHQHQTK